jgi:alkylhydroperoxidase family enzyme
VPTHLALGARVGLTQDQLAHLGEHATHAAFNPRERIVLEYADFMYRSVKLSDELYARLRGEFSEKEIVELAVTVGLGHLINRFHGTFQTELDRILGEFSE